MDGWISVDKYMPTMMVKKYQEEGGRDYLESDYVLVWDGHKAEVARVIFDEYGLYWMDRLSEVVNAVAWMPIPTPPQN